MRNALALTTEGVPLGLVGQIAWARDPETRGKSVAHKPWPIEEKESYRWRIERLHFTLKTGGRQVEDLQLESRERLERAITLYSIVAWRLATTQKPARPVGVGANANWHHSDSLGCGHISRSMGKRLGR